jgi:hypothetical protein
MQDNDALDFNKEKFSSRNVKAAKPTKHLVRAKKIMQSDM